MKSAALATLETGVVIAPQATNDDDMVSLWLGNYRSVNTVQSYATDMRAFRSFCPKPLRSVTVRDVQAFGASLGGFADATAGRRLSAVKSLIGFAHRVGYVPFDVAAPVQLPSIRDTLAERIMTEEQVQRLLWAAETPQRKGPYTRRNATLLRTLYGAGMRVSEVCGLRWRDLAVRVDTGQITIFGKGGKTRPVLLPKPLWDRIDGLRGNSGPDDAVFRSREGGALDRSQVHRIVKIAAKRAKLPGWVCAHCLRHSHASHALDRGAPVHVVQMTLGHSSLTTTTRYSHVRPDDSSAKYISA